MTFELWLDFEIDLYFNRGGSHKENEVITSDWFKNWFVSRKRWIKVAVKVIKRLDHF